MKHLKLSIYLIIATFAISCTKDKLHVINSNKAAEVKLEVKKVENDLPKNGEGFQDFDLGLNILQDQIFGGIYAKEEFDVMIQDITDVVMSEVLVNGNNATTISFSGRIKVEVIKENNVDKYALRIINNVIDTDLDDIILTKACLSVTKKCCTESCIKDVLHDIYVEDREVDVKYRKGTLCRTITYAYQDC